MKLMGILRDEDIVLDLPVRTKTAVLTAASERLGIASGVASDRILEALADRERLGSTAINHGVGVPHARMEALSAPVATFIRLERPIDFEAMDKKPVDLVFTLVWPSDKKDGLLATLGELCRLLREPPLLQGLRAAASASEVREIILHAAEQAAIRTPRS